MRTNEFKARINALGYDMVQGLNGNFFMIKSFKSGKSVADFFLVNEHDDYKDFYLNIEFTKLGQDTQGQLLNLLELYTQTPLDERESLLPLEMSSNYFKKEDEPSDNVIKKLNVDDKIAKLSEDNRLARAECRAVILKTIEKNYASAVTRSDAEMTKALTNAFIEITRG